MKTMWKHVRNLTLLTLILALIVAFIATRPDKAKLELSETEGPTATLGEMRPETIPTINIAEAEGWDEGEKPQAPDGYRVELFADELDHPRNLYRLPNGDILVAEANRPESSGGGVTGWIMRYLFDKVGAGDPSANRITLLRDSDGDGKPETRSVFLDGLNSPFGMALIDDIFYVANVDAVMAFPYEEGALKIEGEGRKIFSLSTSAPNHHWTRNLIASPDGRYLYIAVGSATNIADNGPEVEKARAMIIQYDFEKKKGIPYSIGLRNPVGMDWNPMTQSLWTVVNERDMLGSDLVPDYLTEVEFGSDYGWPHHYYGGHIDPRLDDDEDHMRQYERWPDYALGAHVAALGLLFTDELKLGGKFANGAFVARHGSWNRKPLSGYDVVFVRFDGEGKPVGKPVPFLTGFLDGDDARGRPTMLAADSSGALLLSDDVGNRIWRVTPTRPVAQPQASKSDNPN